MIALRYLPARGRARRAFASTQRCAASRLEHARPAARAAGRGQIRLDYLQAIDVSSRALRSSMPPGEMHELLYTSHYFAIFAAEVGHATVHAVSFELDRLVERFETITKSVEEQKTFWTETGELFLPDTNYWTAEHRNLQTLNYETTLNNGASLVTLVVPMVVVDELDKLKISGGGGGGNDERHRTRTRARAALKFIESHAGQPGSPGQVPGREGMDPPTVSVAVVADERTHHRLPIADDEIVDRAAVLAQVADKQVTLISHDRTGFHLRGRAAGLCVIEPRIPLASERHTGGVEGPSAAK